MSRAAGAVLVVAAVALTVWRAPHYVVAPSFWAEEGMLYFAQAWNAGPLAGLLQRPAGYLTLYANLATTLAAVLVRAGVCSLEAAPRVTAMAALLAQLLPIVLVAAALAPAWGGVWRRAAAIAIVLFGTRTGGLWLNTINSQTFLALAAVVVLLEPAIVGPRRRRVYAIVVGLAGLGSPVAAFLAPLFAWKAWRTRSHAAITIAIVSIGCALVQLACVWAAGSGSLGGRARGVTVGVVAAVAWMRTVVLPTVGSSVALAFASHVRPLVIGTLFHPVGPWFGIFLAATLVMLVAALALGAPKEVRWPLALGYLLVTAGSIVASIGEVGAMLAGVEGNSRYVVVPGVMVLWLLLFNVDRVRSPRGFACVALLVWGLAPSAWEWRRTLRWRDAWPAWRAQVEAWERDPLTPLQIWPRGWKMVLRRE
jgi:hypothetical protein